MGKSKFTESQIVHTLKQVEAGRHLKEVCGELGISEATDSVWSPSMAAWKRRTSAG